MMDCNQWYYPSPASDSFPGPPFPADHSPLTAISHASPLDFMNPHRSFPADLLSPSPPRDTPPPAQTRALSPHPYQRVDSVPPPPPTGPGPVRTKQKHTKHRLRDIDRKRICQYHEQNPNSRQEDIGAQFNVERSTVSKILRDKDRWLKIEEPGDDDAANPQKRYRINKYGNLEAFMIEYLVRWHKTNKPITDYMLRDTALKIARQTMPPEEADKFKASPGWLESFKARKDIVNCVWRRGDAKIYDRSPPGPMYVPDLPPVDPPPSAASAQPSHTFALDPALAHADGSSPPYSSGDLSPHTHDRARSMHPGDEHHEPAASSSRYRTEGTKIEHSPDPYPISQHHYPADHHHQHHSAHSYSPHDHSPHYATPQEAAHASYDRMASSAYPHAPPALAVQVPGAMPQYCPDYPHRHPCQPQNNPQIDPTLKDAEDAVTTLIAFVDRTREPIITEKEREALRTIKCALIQYASGLPFDRTI